MSEFKRLPIASPTGRFSTFTEIVYPQEQQTIRLTEQGFITSYHRSCQFMWNVAPLLRLIMLAIYTSRSIVQSLPKAFKKVSINRTFSTKHTTSQNMLKGLNEFGLTTENSFIKFLNAESTEGKEQHTPRQIFKVHYTQVNPEAVPTPYMIAASDSCAKALGLSPSVFRTSPFVKAFAGNNLLPGLDAPYASNYGCHCYSSWFGQLGDGRAMALGEVLGSDGERYELQLKGCGRSPYSRGFDGRAVLRSSIREYLVSEAMHHLGKWAHKSSLPDAEFSVSRVRLMYCSIHHHNSCHLMCCHCIH